MPDKLLIPPDQASYGFDEFASVLSAKLDGGASRTRVDMIGGDPTVNVKWSVGRTEFETLVDFYKTTTDYGSLPFYLDLILDTADPTEYECHFLPDSFSLQSQRAHRFELGARLEVKPSGRDQEYELAIIMVFEEYGSVEEADGVFAEFDTLFENMVQGPYPYSTIDAENSAIVLAEYGSLTSASEAFAEFDTFFANAVGTPRDYDPEYYDNLAFILGEYGSVDATEGALSEFPVVFEVMSDDYAQELADALAPLLQVYPCCNEDNVDVTLEELETLIGNLPMAEPTMTPEEQAEQTNIIIAYGSAQVADDALQYLEFTVNTQFPDKMYNLPHR